MAIDLDLTNVLIAAGGLGLGLLGFLQGRRSLRTRVKVELNWGMTTPYGEEVLTATARNLGEPRVHLEQPYLLLPTGETLVFPAGVICDRRFPCSLDRGEKVLAAFPLEAVIEALSRAAANPGIMIRAVYRDGTGAEFKSNKFAVARLRR